jgi:hypothetical protein
VYLVVAESKIVYPVLDDLLFLFSLLVERLGCRMDVRAALSRLYVDKLGETAKVVLMKSDPADILRAIKLSKATVRKMKQNLFWASFYNLIAIPVAAGALYPGFGIILRPEVSALLMSASSIIVATNAVLLKREEKELAEA